jgi:hypothetical protein
MKSIILPFFFISILLINLINSNSIQFKRSDDPMYISSCYTMNYTQQLVFNALTNFNVSGTFLPKYLQSQIIKATPNYLGSQLELCLYADWLTFGCWDMQLDEMTNSNYSSWTYFEGCFIGKKLKIFLIFLFFFYILTFTYFYSNINF